MTKRFTYPQYGDVALEGLVSRATAGDGIISAPLSAASVRQVQTVTPTVTNQQATTYSLREANTGQIVTVVSDATPTAQEVCDLLRAAIRANTVLNGMVTVSGTTTLVITARNAGLAGGFNFVDNASGQALSVAATTAAADPAVLPFGRAVTSGSGDGVRLIAAAPSTSNIIRGISCYTEAGIQNQGIGQAVVEGYAPNQAVNILRKGVVWVYVWEAVTRLSPVHVYHTGTRAGQFRASSDGSDTSSLVGTAGTIGGNFSFAGVTSGPGLVELNVNLP